jgi:hypothetical protein
MGYNIEVSFNIYINGSVTQLLEKVRNLAEDCLCENFYEDYEFENKVKYERRHCVMTINFSQENIDNIVIFLKNIKKNKGLLVELIYDEDNNVILYASQYYISQKMNKLSAKTFKLKRLERSYSSDENLILKSVTKENR